MEPMSMPSAWGGSPCPSMWAGQPSQQISSEKGRSLAGMKPGGMSARNANATSMTLAMSIRLLRLRGVKRISRGNRALILPAKSERDWLLDRAQARLSAYHASAQFARIGVGITLRPLGRYPRQLKNLQAS